MGKRALQEQVNLYIILSVTLLSVAGVPSIIPVFPEMSKELGISNNQIGLMITVFTLPGAVLAPLLGMVTDRWGRKKVLLLALVVFGVFGTACFFVLDFTAILVFRFFQGLGAASMGIINITLIGDIFHGDERVKVMGYNSGMLSVATALFPAAGGLLATIDWYYPFLIPALAIAAIPFVHLYLDNPEPSHQPGLIQYFRNMIRNIFTRKAIVMILLTFVTFFLLFGVVMPYLPILLENQFDMSSKEIGFLVSLLAVSMALVASQLRRISRVFSMKFLMATGFVTYLAAFTAIPYIENIYALVAVLLLVGIGLGVSVPVIYNMLTAIAPLEYRGAFMSVNSMANRAGQTLGPLLTGVLFSFWGLSWVFWSGAILAAVFLVFILSYVWPSARS
mgnify:FL=1